MKIKLIAIGKRMPGWVTDAYQQYARRLPPVCQLELVEIAALAWVTLPVGPCVL